MCFHIATPLIQMYGIVMLYLIRNSFILLRLIVEKVKVHFVQEKFPEKTYGQYTFPEGIYDALRIDLGEAKGHNWWCVMFPDLCVTKDDKVRINNTARKKMEKLLGKKTIRKITKDKYLGWLFKA